jgi:hypothetical protein
MKFATFAIAALTGTASADFNLRAAANKLQRPSSSDPAEARVVIHGLTEDASLEDIEMIENSAIAAYNNAYKTAGYSLKSFEAQLSATVPEDAAALSKQSPEQDQLVLATVQSSWNPDCRFCPPDDDASAIKHNLGALHKDFENKLCASLRALGSANLANARDCSFAFLDMPEQSGESLPIEAATLTSADKNMESQVVLHGTLHDLTKRTSSFWTTVSSPPTARPFRRLVTLWHLSRVSRTRTLIPLDDAAGTTGIQAGRPVRTAICKFSVGPIREITILRYYDVPLTQTHLSLLLRLTNSCPPDDDFMMLENTSKIVTARVTPLGWTPDCRFWYV